MSVSEEKLYLAVCEEAPGVVPLRTASPRHQVVPRARRIIFRPGHIRGCLKFEFHTALFAHAPGS